MAEPFSLRSGAEVILKFDHNKLKFTCLKECTSCCHDHKIPLSPYDIQSLCKQLGLKTDAFIEKYTYFSQDTEFQNTLSCNLKLSGPCTLLNDDGLCSVYDSRPFLCRSYPVGVVFGKEKNSYYLHEKTCPGLGCGKKMNIGDYYRASVSEEHEAYHRKWMVFRDVLAKLEIPQTEAYQKRFINICYNFDGPVVDSYIERFGLQGMERLDAVYKIASLVLKKGA